VQTIKSEPEGELDFLSSGTIYLNTYIYLAYCVSKKKNTSGFLNSWIKNCSIVKTPWSLIKTSLHIICIPGEKMQNQTKQTSSNENHHELGAVCQTRACRYKFGCCNNFIITHKTRSISPSGCKSII